MIDQELANATERVLNRIDYGSMRGTTGAFCDDMRHKKFGGGYTVKRTTKSAETFYLVDLDDPGDVVLLNVYLREPVKQDLFCQVATMHNHSFIVRVVDGVTGKSVKIPKDNKLCFEVYTK